MTERGLREQDFCLLTYADDSEDGNAITSGMYCVSYCKKKGKKESAVA